MITIESTMHVVGMRARSVLAFMLTPTDAEYQEWWPGTHFEMHPINDLTGIGQKIVMTELVGSQFLKMRWIVTELASDRITWQLIRCVKLPCWLTLEIHDDSTGATITHTITAGAKGLLGKLLDPLVRLALSDEFADAMDKHFAFEFAQLPGLLQRIRPSTESQESSNGANNAA